MSVAMQGDSRVSMLSLGMKQLGLSDLLMTAPKKDGMRVMATFFDLLAYVAEHRQPLPEVDSVGSSEGERLPVHYVQSPIAPHERVWRVELR